MFAARETKRPTGKLALSRKSGPSPGRVAPEKPTHKLSGSHFVQRNLGNSYLEFIAGSSHTLGPGGFRNGTCAIQRKCSCGGTCTNCASKEKEEKKIQAKLRIGHPNDIYEREADQVAERIMRMPDSAVKTGNEHPGTGISIHRTPEGGSDALDADPDIQLNQTGGRLLSPSTRAFMEPRFAVDFGHVRLHTDSDAHRTAARIQARAFTYGNHVCLGKGESEQNRGLLAHELTHVVQQGPVLPRVQRARLPCYSEKTIDVYAVNLPGSTRSIDDDLPTANSVLCQCGIELKVAGGESWDTNLLDRDPPARVLNAPAGTVRPLTAEESEMLTHKPGGSDVIHIYYVPSFSGPKLAESFWPSQHGEQAVAMSNGVIPIVFPHEIGHVLLDDGSHHATGDNLMAAGGSNTGAGELEEPQCNRMP